MTHTLTINKLQRVTKAVKSDMQLLYRMWFSTLILSAGMPRSGSTLLFNIIRTCLEYKYEDDLVSGWIGDMAVMPRAKVCLVKSHDVDRVLAYRANTYFYSYRDVRDALVSSKKKFSHEPSIEYCRYYIKGYMAAERVATETFKYEEFSKNIEGTVDRIQRHFNIQVASKEIVDRLPRLQERDGTGAGYDEKTLMHGKHATHTKDGEWRSVLDEELLSRIRQEYGWWLRKNGYALY